MKNVKTLTKTCIICGRVYVEEKLVNYYYYYYYENRFFKDQF